MLRVMNNKFRVRMEGSDVMDEFRVEVKNPSLNDTDENVWEFVEGYSNREDAVASMNALWKYLTFEEMMNSAGFDFIFRVEESSRRFELIRVCEVGEMVLEGTVTEPQPAEDVFMYLPFDTFQVYFSFIPKEI